MITRPLAPLPRSHLYTRSFAAVPLWLERTHLSLSPSRSSSRGRGAGPAPLHRAMRFTGIQIPVPVMHAVTPKVRECPYVYIPAPGPNPESMISYHRILSHLTSMAVSYFYAHADVDLEGGGLPGATDRDTVAPNLSGSDSTAAVNRTVADCEAGTSTATVEGRSPPGFLLWALCVYMIATQLCYWQGQCATRLRVKREARASAIMP